MTTMNELDLEKEFYNMENMLAPMKLRADEMSARTLLTRGPYVEFPVFSYQRNRMQQGKLIKNANRIKSYNNVYCYTFDSLERLIREERGIQSDPFFNVFYLYDKDGNLYLSYAYNDIGRPANVTSYKFISGKLQSSELYGRYGVRKEKFFYDGDVLRKIVISGHNHGEEDPGDVSEYFHYDDAGALYQIELEYKIGDSEIIYQRRE